MTDTANTPTPKTDTSGWPWWWSKDEERYSGPFASRHDAIMDAFADGEIGAVHVQQACQDEPRVDLWTGADLAERFDEINEDRGDPEGASLSAEIPEAKWDALASLLTAQARAMVRKQGVTSWAFGGTAGGEWVHLSRARRAALPTEALDLLDEIALGFDPEVGWAESYVDEKIAELKEAVRRPTKAVAR